MIRRGFYGMGSGFNGIRHINGVGHIIALAVFVVVAIVVIMHFARKTKKHTNDAALEELKIRFAKGEITEEEYLRKKNII